MPDAVIVAAETPETPVDAKELIVKMLDEAEAKEKECALKLCALIKAVGMAGKDLHYRAKGEAFYSDHLLADLGWQIERLSDDFIEVYYMGDKGWDAPLMSKVYGMARDEMPYVDDDVAKDAGTEFWARRLLETCEKLAKQVEEAKANLMARSGTQAAMDEISKQALQVAGLLKRTVK